MFTDFRLPQTASPQCEQWRASVMNCHRVPHTHTVSRAGNANPGHCPVLAQRLLQSFGLVQCCSASVATRQTSSAHQNIRFCNDYGGKTYTYKQTFRLDCTRSTGNYTLRLEIKHLLASFLWVDDNKLLPHGSPRRCQRTSNETAALAELTQAGTPLHSQWLSLIATSTIGFDEENIIHFCRHKDKHQSQVLLKYRIDLKLSSNSFKSRFEKPDLILKNLKSNDEVSHEAWYLENYSASHNWNYQCCLQFQINNDRFGIETLFPGYWNVRNSWIWTLCYLQEIQQLASERELS